MFTQTANSVKQKSFSRKSVKAPMKKKVVKQLNRTQLLKFIENQLGKFVSIDYIKLDGTKRKLTGRLGVKKFLHGGRNNVERLERSYLVIFDIKLMDYRTVNLETVEQIRAGGIIWNVID